MHYKRREQPRLKFGVVVKDKKNKRQGKTRDISVDGCFIEKKGEFEELLPIGSPIELILDFPNADKKFKVSGVVKHHGTHEDGTGIRFEKIDDHAVVIIEQFIKTFLDDILGEEWAKTKEEYWDEVDRLKEKIPHKDHQA
jgi:hypothetical protein